MARIPAAFAGAALLGLAALTMTVHAQPAIGTLVVHVSPPSVVYVDGKPLTPDAAEKGAPVPEGVHRVQIVNPDYQNLRRTIQIMAGQTTTVTIALADKGVRKVAAAGAPRGPTTAGRGRGASSTRNAASGRGGGPLLVTDSGLQRAIQFVDEGDFQPAVDTLLAVTRDLAGVPRLIREQAIAFLYLGAAWIELDQPDQAKRAFALAQRTDKGLAPRASDFSRQTLLLWEEARAVPETEEIDLTPKPTAPVDHVTDPAKDDGTSPRDNGDGEFISDDGNAVTFQLASPTAGQPCFGRLTVAHDQQSVGWTPAADGCTPAFEVPFAELRSPAAAPRGGLLLQFRSERPSMVLMPAPDADLLDPAAEKMTLNDLPPSTRVNLRRAQKRMYQALSRPWSDSITNLLVDVPLAELIDSPQDYEGGVVRTSGKLASASGSRGPFRLIDEKAAVQIVAAGSAVPLMKARAAEWAGKELIVSGTFSRPPLTANAPKGAGSRPPFVLTATSVEPAEGVKYNGPARTLSLEEVVKNPPPGRELVRVVGVYRGFNSFGDLPNSSRRQANDYVIKEGQFPIWVSGKPPAGLDPSVDAGMQSVWLAITGTVEERKGFLYLRAAKAEVSPRPSDTSGVAGGAALVGLRGVHPDITFTVPNIGTEEMSRDQQILIQFTKPMDEKSFTGRVELRYVDHSEVKFPFLSITYYADRRNSVIIDPGAALVPGRTVECVLLPGIKDTDNQPLVGVEDQGGRVLRWRVRGRGAS